MGKKPKVNKIEQKRLILLNIASFSRSCPPIPAKTGRDGIPCRARQLVFPNEPTPLRVFRFPPKLKRREQVLLRRPRQFKIATVAITSRDAQKERNNA